VNCAVSDESFNETWSRATPPAVTGRVAPGRGERVEGRGDRLVAGRRDETAGEDLGRALRGLADDRGGQVLVAADPDQPAQGARQSGEVVVEILLGEALRFVAAARGIEGGEDVEVAQQARAEMVVGDGAREEPILDPLGEARPVALGGVEQRLAQGLRPRFDAAAVARRRHVPSAPPRASASIAARSARMSREIAYRHGPDSAPTRAGTSSE
jgi:hypothetical protein